MIIGIGHDVVELSRMRSILLGANGKRFVSRVLSQAEQEHAYSRFGSEPPTHRWVEFVSGRFAAKEAVVKALGCGIGSLVGFHDIEIIPDKLGKPICTLSLGASERAGISQHAYIHLSITHTEGIASAYVIVEQRS